MSNQWVFTLNRFQNFEDLQLEIQSIGKQITLLTNEEVCTLNSTEYVYLIVSGICQIVHFSSDGERLPVGFIDSGLFICEDNRPNNPEIVSKQRKGIVMSVGPVKLVKLTRNTFEFLVRSSVRMQDYIMAQRNIKEQAYTSQIASLQTHSLRQRVINLLTYLAYKDDVDKRGYISIKVIRKDLATLVFCSRESMGQRLKTLEKEGLIELKGRTIRFNREDLGSHAAF